MNLRKFHHLLAVIDNQNMRAAAEAVHLSQPALSRSLKSLEDELGITLLDRSYGKVLPTAYSAQVIQHIRSVTSEARALSELVRRIKGLDEGEIRIGIGPFAATVLGSIIRELVERHPQLSLQIQVRHPTLLIEFLLQGRLDLIVCDSRYLEDEGIFSSIRLPGQPLAFAASHDHPLRQREGLQLSHLSGYPIFGPFLPTEWLTALRSLGLNYAPGVDCDDTNLLLELAATTKAVVFLPELAISSANAKSWKVAGLPLELPIEPYSHPCIFHRHGKTLGPASTLLINLIRDSFASCRSRFS